MRLAATIPDPRPANAPDMTGTPAPGRLDIGVIIPLLNKYGGAERYLIECLRRWQHRHDITIYAHSISDSLLTEHGIGPGVRRAPLSNYFSGEHAMLLNGTLLPSIWRGEIGRHDVYYAHLWPTHLIDVDPMVCILHEPLRLLYDLRFDQDFLGDGSVVQAHLYPKPSYDYLAASTLEAELRALERFDRIGSPLQMVANSAQSARQLSAVFGRTVDTVVHPGVDIDGFIDLPTDTNLFVAIGQLWPHKRINLLIEAVALTDSAQLAVIGAGPQAERLRLMAERLGVDDRVFFLTDLNNRELRLLLARAAALLFAPVREPFGIVVLEGMAAGRPIIAVDEGGYTEVCHPDYAFLLPPYPAAFAEKMMLLQRDPELGRRMGAAARHAATAHTWQHCADRNEQLLVEACLTAKAARPEAARQQQRPLVGIQYFMWYGQGHGEAHWNDNPVHGYVTEKPLLGFYDSVQGRTIEHHLSTFEEMGLDFVIPNLHVDESGPNRREQAGIRNLLAIAERRRSDLRVAIQLCPYGRSVAAVNEALQDIAAHQASHPNYLQHGGKPVLFWFWSGALDANWEFFAAIAEHAARFTHVALGLRLPSGTGEQLRTGAFFSGFGPFSPLELADRDNWEKIWDVAYRDAERNGMTCRTATISPGYDDTALRDSRRAGNAFRQIAREDGATYARCMSFVEALDPPPHFVTVSTFNEFHENSHIEPTLGMGTHYVDMTAQFTARLRSRHGGGL